MTHITTSDSCFVMGFCRDPAPNDDGFRLTSAVHFEPTVYIHGGGTSNGDRDDSFFTLQITCSRDLLYNASTPHFSIPIYTKSLELSFSNLHFIMVLTVRMLWSCSIPPSFLTLFASPVYSYGGIATFTTFTLFIHFLLQ